MCKSIVKNPVDRITPDRAEYSVDLFLQGYNCSECIVMAFADQFDIELDIAARISGGFGFNNGREKGKTCGVVTGAIMVIGLKYGAGLNRDPYAHDLCTLVIHEFLNRFVARRSSVACRKIHLTRKDPEIIRNLEGGDAFCAKVAKDAAEIIEEIFAQEYS